MKYSSPIHLVIATPAYGRQITAVYASSVLQFLEVSKEYGIHQVEVAVQGGDALVSRARQDLVTRFLETPQATHMLFIDSDIGFQPQQIKRLLELDVEMAAGVYPYKHLDLDRVRKLQERKPNYKVSELWSYGVEFQDPRNLILKKDFALARYVGMGFVLIKKSLFQKLIRHYPELKYTGGFLPSDPFPESQNRFALFNEFIDEKTGHYLSEDRSFCRRWTQIGGEIWVDLQSRLQHVGPTVFEGDFSTQWS